MVDVKRGLLLTGAGFLIGLYLLTRVSLLRPMSTTSSPVNTSLDSFHIPGIDERRGGFVGERPS